MAKLKIFSDKNYVLDQGLYEPMLYPFWGKPRVNSDNPFKGYYPHYINFDSYLEIADSLFEMSSPEEADLIVIPNNWANWEEIQEGDPRITTPKNQLSIQFFEKYQVLDKPFVSFFGSDFSHIYRLPISSNLIFRTSLSKKRRERVDFAMPLWCEDFVHTRLNHQLQIRQKSSKPIVGFDGYVPTPTLKWRIKEVAHDFEKAVFNDLTLSTRLFPKIDLYHVLRMKIIPALAESSLVTANFSIRDNLFFNLRDLKQQKLLRTKFIKNMIDSDYIVCPPGCTPISVRFYEALACGRIPIFINSDTVLPYEFAIDWKKYCIWIEEGEISQIDQKISEFHDRLSPQDFIDLQHQCRKIWKKWCSVEGFFSHFYRHLDLSGGLKSRVGSQQPLSVQAENRSSLVR
jgi:hypothetical protein